MKICVVSVGREEVRRNFVAATEKALEKVREPDTQIAIKSSKRGPDTIAQQVHPYTFYLSTGEVIERILEAERQGYDAAVVNMTSDIGVLEARSIVNIPVIGPSEATMHYACMLGAKFGIVALNEAMLRPMYERLIWQFGLKERAIANPVRFTSIRAQVLMDRWQEDPSWVIPSVLETSKRCMEDGAEVIIVAGTILGVACTLAGLSSVEVDGGEVPLLSPLVIEQVD